MAKLLNAVTNIEVLNKISNEKELLYSVKKRKLLYTGHIVRDDILRLDIEGTIPGKT